MAFLDREYSVAGPGFSRWLVPPAALAVHLSIGQIYAYSVFNEPMSRLIGGAEAAPGDWSLVTIGWIFSIALAVLGASAAIFGKWLERVGPRKAMFYSACCFAGGFLVAALGLYWHQIWLVYLGNGLLGGIGLGLGYISPVSTLIKWFPDRPGMATGMAIMGFGGGAMIGAPLADRLMKLFATPESVGVSQTFIVLAGIYFVFMMAGALGYRVPPTGWKPAGWTPSPAKAKDAMVTQRHVHANEALKTPQFWLIWGVLCLNVSAGIGVLGMASPLLQEVFGGKLLGVTTSFMDLTAAQKGQIAAIAAGFTGLLSLFNIGGQGQYIAGTVGAVWVGSSFEGMPHALHVILAILAALAGGALWGGIAGLLRATTGANEVITTIMLNWTAVYLGSYLFGLGGPLQNSDPTQQSIPVSNDVVQGARLPVFWGDPELQGLHIGIFIALFATIYLLR